MKHTYSMPYWFNPRFTRLLALFLLMLAGCKKEEPETLIQPLVDAKTITDTALDADRFSLLSEAWKKTGLDATLQGTGPFTVFAPNNTAFAAALQVLGYPNVAAVPTEALKNILLYHVVEGKKDAASLNQSYLATQLASHSIGISRLDDQVYVNGSTTVLNPDINASNGILHEVDKVLLPPSKTVAEIIAGLPDQFSLLSEALTKTGLDVTLQGAGPFTVFAPNNAAFEDALATLEYASIDEVPTEALKNLLLYHVVPGVNFGLDLTRGLALPTQQGVDIAFSVLSDQVYLNGESNALNPSYTVAVTGAQAQGTNGVVQEVNGVLDPPRENLFASLSDPAVVPFNTTNLRAQLVRTGLDVVLATGGPYTLFAPSNGAFTEEAFKQFIVDKGYAPDLASADADDVPVEVMRKILQYHVINGRTFLYDVETATVPTLAGENLEIDGNDLTIGGVPLDTDNFFYDFNTTNGVVHRIFDGTGAILIPPSLQ